MVSAALELPAVAVFKVPDNWVTVEQAVNYPTLAELSYITRKAYVPRIVQQLCETNAVLAQLVRNA